MRTLWKRKRIYSLIERLRSGIEYLEIFVNIHMILLRDTCFTSFPDAPPTDESIYGIAFVLDKTIYVAKL